MDIRLANIANQAAGFYFLLHDNSQVPSVASTSTMRLIFINVAKGPVNSLVYINKGDKSGFKAIFGDIDRREERNGNFSIRTALIALENAPIMVCNLRSFDDTKDLAGMIGLSTTINTVNSIAQKVPYSQLYNTERLWYSDYKQLLKQPTSNWLNLANTGSTDVSIFVRKSTVKGYDVTLKSWYDTLSQELPLYVNPMDYVSDTMVDVYVFKTNFGDNMINMSNENYGYLFDENGLKSTIEQNGVIVDSLSVLSTISDAQYVSMHTGSLIPGMLDSAGNSLQIQLELNANTQSTGILSAFDESMAEDLGDWEGEFDEYGKPIYASDKSKKPYAIDLVGHSLFHINELNEVQPIQPKINSLLSYNKELKSGSCVIDMNSSEVIMTDVYDADQITMSAFIPVTNTSQYTFNIFDAVNIGYHDRVVGADGNLKRITKTTATGKTKTIIEGFKKEGLPIMPNGEVYPKDELGNYIYPIVPLMNAESTRPIAIYNDFSEIEFRGVGTDLRAVQNEDGSVRSVGAIDKVYLFDVNDVHIYKEGDYLTYTGNDFHDELPTEIGTLELVTILSNSVYPIVGVVTYNTVDYIAVDTTAAILMHEGNEPLEFDADGNPLHQITNDVYEPTISETQLEKYKSEYGTVYNFVTCDAEGVVHMGDVATITANPDNVISLLMDDGTTMDVYHVNIIKFNPISSNAYSLQSIVLPAYKSRREQFTNGTAAKQSEILDIMLQSNMIKGLKNSQELKPRYLVDAFKTYIEPSYKFQFSSLAKELSENSTVFTRALINEAFVEDMSESKNPYFKSTASGNFDAQYIETGGNTKLQSTNTYTKPTDGDKYSFYFGPGITVNHYGTSVIMPPAGLVSKVFIDKYTYNQPYTIVANKTGLLTGENVTGVEIDFDQDDRAPLERVGYNAIIRELGTGLMVYGNNTGQYRIKTSMSKIHVSELIAYMQEQMLTILKDYVFSYNDYQNRLEIKKRADEIMNRILDNGGVLYYENICDATNNTTEIIENDMGILDTIIVAAHGMEKMVHRTYLERGSNISGFELQ